jgi:hypothetical protein
MNELVVRIRGPVSRLPPASDDDARTGRRHSWSRLHRRCQVHQQADRREDPLSVVYETDELTQRGLSTQIDDTS